MSTSPFPRDYRLHELSDAEFEKLVVRICVRWLGEGVTPFAPGKDKGRDGKFHGTANCFPSTSEPLVGHCVLQAKHTASPDKSCSDRDFARTVKDEHPKVKRLVEDGLCDHYLLFTNRKYSGGTDEKLPVELRKLGPKSVHIIGIERLHLALDEYPDIRETLPNRYDSTPFRFDPADLVDVISALHEFSHADATGLFQSAYDFEKLGIQKKNNINGVTKDYFEQSIVAGSMPHFERVEQFLENPRNVAFSALYHDAADDLKQKIIVKRSSFQAFDDIFLFLYEKIQEKKHELRGKRRLITILLHYMYCNCDIGMKEVLPINEVVDAHA